MSNDLDCSQCGRNVPIRRGQFIRGKRVCSSCFVKYYKARRERRLFKEARNEAPKSDGV